MGLFRYLILFGLSVAGSRLQGGLVLSALAETPVQSHDGVRLLRSDFTSGKSQGIEFFLSRQGTLV